MHFQAGRRKSLVGAFSVIGELQSSWRIVWSSTVYCLVLVSSLFAPSFPIPGDWQLTADRCLVSSNFDINIKNIIHYFSAFTNKNLYKIKTLIRMQGLNIHRLPTSRYWDRDTSWIISFKDISQPNRPIVFSCFMDKCPNLGWKDRF